MTRLQRERKSREDDNYEPPMPPVESARHILTYLFDAGPAMSGGMGPVALTSQELASWQALGHIRLAPWEAQFLRRLSREYVDELAEASDPKRRAPWHPDSSEIDHKAVGLSMREKMRELSKL